MTLDEAISILKARIPAFTALVHSEVDLKSLLEQGANEVAALTLCYERRAVLNFLAIPPLPLLGQREYLIAGPSNMGGLGIPDVLRILSVHQDGMPLTMITPEGYGAAQLGGLGPGVPAFWYEFSGRLGFRPVPSAAWLSDFTIEISYAASVGTWTSGECVLPPAFDDLILEYAYLKAMLREEQWEEAIAGFLDWFDDIKGQTSLARRPATQQSGPPMAPTQARDRQRQKR